jgi:hypothetical protein
LYMLGKSMKIVSVLFMVLVLAGGIFSSCKYAPNGPEKKCDTCCDTCHKMDTTKHGCDTCNIDKDSAAHAFVWTEYVDKIPGETSPTGVWVFGKNDIYIVANSLWHFDGSTFTIVPAFDKTFNNVTMNGALNGNNIFAFSKNDFWMVYGNGGDIAYHTSDGKYFDDFRPKGAITACWGTSSTDMYFVGKEGLIYHYDGVKFTQMTSNTTKDLRSVWGTNSNNIWACGYSTSSGTTVLLHYNGDTWSEDPLSVSKGLSATGGFNTVWACDSSLGHQFVSTSGAILIRQSNNGAWRSDSGLIPNRLNDGSFIGIASKGNTPNDMVAYGPWGFLAHWNGKTWKQYTQLYNYGNPLYYTSALSMNGNTICAVGVKSGQSWIAVGQRK